jgi:3'-phosphoadenosine 5'-phosphosulfate sulfotransferase (PAPS reductase)/FAD synthetase
MTLFERQMAEGRIYARLSVRKRRLEFALEGILRMREIARRSYLSLSFGKQSICLAHMLYQIEPTLPMFFLASGETWMIHDYERVIDSFLSRWPVNLTIVQTDHVFNGAEKTWIQSLEAGHWDLQTMCRREEWDGWYWGLSKDESFKRRLTLRAQQKTSIHPTIFRYADGKYRCCPLMNWSLLDLAAYLGEYELPLLSDYQQQGLQVRTTARVTRYCAELNGVAQIKETNIEAFNKLCARFPELRAKT